MEKIDIRFVRNKDTIYLRLEDVIEYILGIAKCEETSVRHRLEQAVKNINEVGAKHWI